MGFCVFIRLLIVSITAKITSELIWSSEIFLGDTFFIERERMCVAN